MGKDILIAATTSDSSCDAWELQSQWRTQLTLRVPNTWQTLRWHFTSSDLNTQFTQLNASLSSLSCHMIISCVKSLFRHLYKYQTISQLQLVQQCIQISTKIINSPKKLPLTGLEPSGIRVEHKRSQVQSPVCKVCRICRIQWPLLGSYVCFITISLVPVISVRVLHLSHNN